MKGTATLFLRDGQKAFEVRSDTFGAMNMLDDLKRKIEYEFDHCFEADEWGKIVINIERD